MSGIYHADSIKDAAESLGISNLSDGVAAMLACDLEYRLHQIIDEASRFTRHGKRTTLTTTDVDQAFRVLNIEPVYGHSGLNAPSFKKAIPTVGAPVYALQDEEIDFDKVIKEEEIPVPRAVSWTAHWLAIEGVQPLIPENPSPTTTVSTSATSKPRLAQPQANGATSPTQPQNNKAPLTTKSHLSRELQQYYARLTDSLLPGNLIETGSDRALDRKRTAALSSLRNDAGLQGILPYLVKWVGDSVMGALAIRSGPDDEMGDLEEDIDRRVLEVMLMVIHAILDNQRLFVEPYLHMLLPPLLSVLLTSTLSSTSSYSSLDSPAPTPRTLRTQAASLVAHLLKLHAPSYPSLPPRITKTLLVALLDDGSTLRPGASPESESAKKPLSLGTKDGAIRGLIGVGHEAVHRGLIAGQAAKLVGEEVERRVGRGDNDAMMDLSGLNDGGGEGEWAEEVRDVVNASLEAFATIHPFPAGAAEGNFASFMSRPNAAQVNDAREQLTGYLGPFFATRVCQKSTQWGVGLAKALADRASAVGGTPGGTGGLASNLDNLALDAHRESGTAPMDVMSQAEGFALVEEPSSGMGMSLGMGGDLGGLGSEAMDAT